MGTQILQMFLVAQSNLHKAKNAFSIKDLTSLKGLLVESLIRDKDSYLRIKNLFSALFIQKLYELNKLNDIIILFLENVLKDAFLSQIQKDLKIVMNQLEIKIKSQSHKFTIEELLSANQNVIYNQGKTQSPINVLLEQIIVTKLRQKTNLTSDYILSIYERFSGNPNTTNKDYDYNGLLLVVKETILVSDLESLLHVYRNKNFIIKSKIENLFRDRIKELGLEILKSKKTISEIRKFMESQPNYLAPEADEMILILLHEIDKMSLLEIYQNKEVVNLIKDDFVFKKSGRQVKEVLSNTQHFGKFKSLLELFQCYVELKNEQPWDPGIIHNPHIESYLIQKISLCGIKGFLFFLKKYPVSFLQKPLEELIKNEGSLKKIDSALLYVEKVQNYYIFQNIKKLLYTRAINLINDFSQLDFEILLEKCIKNNYFYGNKDFFVKKAKSFL